MTLAILTTATFVGINLVGLVVSWYLDTRGIPEEAAIDRATRKAGGFRRRLPLILVNLAAMSTLTFGGMWLLQDAFAMSWPGWTLFFVQFATILLIDDAVFYTVHRVIHEVPALYRRVHKLHHEAYAPLPSEYLYVHPAELSAGGMGVVLGSIVAYALGGTLYLAPFLSYVVVRNLHELDIHSGIRSTLTLFIPALAPNEHHDLHHHRPNAGNYASMLTVWDDLLGTRVVQDPVRVPRPARPAPSIGH